MSRTLRAVAAIALGALAPGGASAVDWAAHAGVDYQRLDSESTSGAASSVPRLDVNLTLDTSGAVPGILGWTAGVGYRRVAISTEGFDDVRDQVNYRLRSSLFGSGRVAAEAFATRSDEDVSLESVSSTSVQTTTYGGTLRVQPAERPFLSAGYAFAGTEMETPGVGPTERSIHSINASTGFGSPSYTYRATYQLNLSDGTFALDDYDDHRVEFLVDADVAPDARLTLSEGYYLREPGAQGATLNPRYETNAFVANLRVDEGRRDVQAVSYGYSHALRTIAAAEVERTRHRVGYSVERIMPNPEWRLRGDLRVAYSEDRLEQGTARTAGESLGLTAFWRRTRKPDTFELHAGPNVGLLQPEGGGTRVGYGARAGGFMTRLVGAVSTSVSYDLTYARDLDADAGWGISQAAIGSASGRLGRGSLRGSLQLAANRRDHPLLGTAATRSITATSEYGWQRNNLYLQASMQDGGDGLSGGVRDGLFIAPAFESHTRSAALGAATSPWSFLTLRGRLRYASSDLPDRPSTDEKEAFGAVEYVYGALRISLEDRYVIAATGGGELRVNQVFLRASRTIGSRH